MKTGLWENDIEKNLIHQESSIASIKVASCRNRKDRKKKATFSPVIGSHS